MFFVLLHLKSHHHSSPFVPLLPCSLLLSMLSALNVRSLEFINYGASLLIGFPRRPYTPPTTCRRACACSIFLFSTFDLPASSTQPFAFLSVQAFVFNSYLLVTLNVALHTSIGCVCASHMCLCGFQYNLPHHNHSSRPSFNTSPCLHFLPYAITRFPSDGINQAFSPGDLRTIICFASLTPSVRLPKQETGEYAARSPFTLRHNGSMGDQITLRSSK